MVRLRDTVQGSFLNVMAAKLRILERKVDLLLPLLPGASEVALEALSCVSPSTPPSRGLAFANLELQPAVFEAVQKTKRRRRSSTASKFRWNPDAAVFLPSLEPVLEEECVVNSVTSPVDSDAAGAGKAVGSRGLLDVFGVSSSLPVPAV